MVRAKTIRRINVWGTGTQASNAHIDGVDKLERRMTVYDSHADAEAYSTYPLEGGGGDYEGPLDIVSGAIVAYSTARALSSAYRGSTLYTIREDAGDTTQAFSCDATTGLAPVASITAFLSGSDGLVTALNDQSGAGQTLSGVVEDQQPLVVLSDIGGRVGFTNRPPLSQGKFELVGTYDPEITMPGSISMFLVFAGVAYVRARMHDEIGNYTQLYGVTTGGSYADSLSGLNEAGGFSNSAATPTPQLLECSWEYGTIVGTINGADAEFDSGLDTGGALDPISNFRALISSDENAFLDQSHFAEWIVYPGLLTTQQRSDIRQNIAAFYGITLA